MIKYSLMIGVLEGYGHENEELTQDRALELGTNSYEKNGKIDNDVHISPSVAIYLQDWGCPKGGELGISLSGKVENEEELQQIVESVKGMMTDLKQQTVTIEYSVDDGDVGSIYLSEGGEKVTNNKPDGAEHFKIKLPTSGKDMQTIGSQIQELISEQGDIKSTGVLIEEMGEDGKKYYVYEGTQNMMFCPSKKEYAKAICTLADSYTRMEENPNSLVVELNEGNIIVGERKENLEEKKESKKKPNIENELER